MSHCGPFQADPLCDSELVHPREEPEANQHVCLCVGMDAMWLSSRHSPRAKPERTE